MQTAQFIGKEKIQAGLVDPTTISLVQKKERKIKVSGEISHDRKWQTAIKQEHHLNMNIRLNDECTAGQTTVFLPHLQSNPSSRTKTCQMNDGLVD